MPSHASVWPELQLDWPMMLSLGETVQAALDEQLTILCLCLSSAALKHYNAGYAKPGGMKQRFAQFTAGA